MFKRFIKVRFVLVIFSLVVFLSVPAQVSKADSASCAIAVAAAAAALAEQQAACSAGPSSGVCQYLTAIACEQAAAMANECPVV
jgi:hypothetical protein